MKPMMKYGLILLLLASLVAAATAIGPLIVNKYVLSSQPVPYGAPVNFEIDLINIGDVDLTVSAIDPQVRTCDSPGTTLLRAHTSQGYLCNLPSATGSFVNTVTATGTDGLGNTYTASGSANVEVQGCVPGFEVSINPETQSIAYGGTATWQISATNTGTCPLTNVRVSDVNAAVVDTGCSLTIPQLLPGNPYTYTCSQANVVANFKKVINAVARDPRGAEWLSTDTAFVFVIPCNPSLTVFGTPAAQFVHSGGTAKWSIAVTNTGDTDLTGVAVSGSVCKKTIGSLKKGATSTYSCSKAGYKRGTSNNMYTYPLTAKGTACGLTVTGKEALWVTVKP